MKGFVKGTGRLKDIIIEEFISYNEYSGTMEPDHNYDYKIWADKDCFETISKTEGVSAVWTSNLGFFLVTIDQRYDKNFVIKEVESAILCKEKTEEPEEEPKG